MELNTGQWVVIILCAVLIIAYIRGFLYNRQQAEQIARWLADGLKEWGEVTPGEKMPGMVTGGRLVVEQAAAPLRKIEALYILAPRDNPLFWLFHRLSGRGDELIVWVTFQHKPDQEIEAARKGDRQFASRLKAKDKPALTLVDAPAGFQMACQARNGTPPADVGAQGLRPQLKDFIQRRSSALIRLALRPNKPHLFLRADLRKVRARPARELLQELSELKG